MQSHRSDETVERIEEIKSDYEKAHEYDSTIIGRKRFRELRVILHRLGVRIHIPMNSAGFSDEYCKKYGKETNRWKCDPAVLKEIERRT